MENEYRDTLAAAQRRIEQLETELQLARQGIVPPKPNRGPAFSGFVAVLVGVTSLAACGGVVESVRLRLVGRPRPTPVSVTSVPASTVHGVTFYTAGDSHPELVDVDGDGTKEIVSLFWGGAQDRPLHVGALDRNTLKAKWMAGPYPSQWSGPHTHLAITGSRLVVTDSREAIHVLDLKTGEETLTAPLPGGATGTCVPNVNEADVILQTDWNKWKVLDAQHGEFRELKKAEYTQCTTKKYDATACSATSVHSRVCIEYDKTAHGRSQTPGFQGYGGTTLLGDARMVQGRVELPNGAPPADALLVLDRTTKARRWEQRALRDGDLLHIGGNVHNTLTESSVITEYQMYGGGYRLFARDVVTGKEKWAVKVSNAAEGSYLGQTFVEGGEIFMFIDHTLHIFELETGKERASTTWL